MSSSSEDRSERQAGGLPFILDSAWLTEVPDHFTVRYSNSTGGVLVNSI